MALTLKVPPNNAFENAFAKGVCCTYLLHVSVEANSVDPDQTALIAEVWSGIQCLAKRFLKHFSR